MPAKIDLSTDQLIRIKSLFDQEFGTRKISKIMGISRWIVQKGYKALGIYNSGRKTPRFVHKLTEKICRDCDQTKPIFEFRKRTRPYGFSYEPFCRNCEYRRSLKRLKEQAKILRETDPNFVIRKSVSYFIWKGLKKNGSSKKGKSCLDYLGYTIQDLRQHLEQQFEPWMNWENHGNYRVKTWDDSNSDTWTWQIDHIIPQSMFSYTSMEDEDFKKCWALDNLRPLNAKQNFLDGIRKTRHK